MFNSYDTRPLIIWLTYIISGFLFYKFFWSNVPEWFNLFGIFIEQRTNIGEIYFLPIMLVLAFYTLFISVAGFIGLSGFIGKKLSDILSD